ILLYFLLNAFCFCLLHALCGAVAGFGMDHALQIDMLSELHLREVVAVVVVCQVLGLHKRIKAFLFQGTMLVPHPQPRGLGSTLSGQCLCGVEGQSALGTAGVGVAISTHVRELSHRALGTVGSMAESGV
uniref:Uncharacterized protein n=1 Tax=Crocodylus porosus TaxID=8502 RepID=A0A7M4F006_CROPO